MVLRFELGLEIRHHSLSLEAVLGIDLHPGVLCV